MCKIVGFVEILETLTVNFCLLLDSFVYTSQLIKLLSIADVFFVI